MGQNSFCIIKNLHGENKWTHKSELKDKKIKFNATFLAWSIHFRHKKYFHG